MTYSFEADVARSQMFTSDVIKARNVQQSIRNMIYHKLSHSPAFYMVNGKNVYVMLEFDIVLQLLIAAVITLKKNKF